MSDCDCSKTVCPKHHGSFDCTPFCDICEGNTEYCATHDAWEALQAETYLRMYNVSGQMYNGYNNATLEELRQRIV